MRASVVLVACLFVEGCGGGPTAPTARLTVPAAPTTYDGDWTGQTEQGEAATFAVAGNKITRVEFHFKVTSTEHACTGVVAFGGSTLGTIANDSFLLVTPFTIPGVTRWVITGMFTSPSNAAGTLEMNITSLNPASSLSCVESVKTAWAAGKS